MNILPKNAKNKFIRDIYEASFYSPADGNVADYWNLYRKSENVAIISEDGKGVSFFNANSSHSKEDILKIIQIMADIENQVWKIENQML